MGKKVVIIGSGYVGSTTAYTMLTGHTADEIVLIDANQDKAEGDALDMNHGMSFLPPVKLYAGSYPDCADASLIILTAGAAQVPGEKRLELTGRNKKACDDILTSLAPHLSEEAILLVVTNPVDVLTQYVLEATGLPKEQVIGSGTVLDTSRLKWAIAEHVGVDPRDVHAFIVGEHGDSAVPFFSAASVSGMRLCDYCARCGGCGYHSDLFTIGENITQAAYEIIAKKGATYYAVALAVNRIAESILRDQKAVLTVSGRSDVYNTCLSLPRIIGAKGIESLWNISYSTSEQDALQKSAEIIKRACRKEAVR